MERQRQDQEENATQNELLFNKSTNCIDDLAKNKIQNGENELDIQMENPKQDQERPPETAEGKKGFLATFIGDGGEEKAEQIKEKTWGIDYKQPKSSDFHEEEEDDLPKRPVEPPLYECSYRISLEQFAAFEAYYSQERIRKDKKTKAVVGALEIVVAILYLYQIMQGVLIVSFWNIAFVLLFLGLGIYSMLYYRYFYEKRKALAVKMHYEKNEYLQSDITLSIYENCFVENVANTDTVHFWHNIVGVRELPQCFHLIIQNYRVLMVPKSSDPNEVKQLRSHLLDGCDRFEKDWYTE